MPHQIVKGGNDVSPTVYSEKLLDCFGSKQWQLEINQNLTTLIRVI